MAKFARTTSKRLPPSSAVRTTTRDTRTFEGAPAYSRTSESDLFLLAITNMVGEDTFYESAAARDSRFVQLIHTVTKANPEWVAAFVPWLRSEARMRSASIVVAAEYVAAGGERGRGVVSAALQRADEPAEMLMYWHMAHGQVGTNGVPKPIGRNLPKPIKRGVADAVTRLYTERNVLRYDGNAKALRFADVLELVHPLTPSLAQDDLWKYLLNQRHHKDGVTDGLPVLRSGERLLAEPMDQRRAFLRTELGQALLDQSRWSWELLSGYLPGGMDAEAWQWVIPNMGVMALIRNLRNFDQAGISEATIDAVIAKVTDPHEVEASRIFPYQVWSAYKNAPSDNWKRALAKTLDATVQNTPTFKGKTMVAVDVSGSMGAPLSARSTIERAEVAMVMAMATWAKNPNTDIVLFGTGNSKITIPKGTSVLSGVTQLLAIFQTGALGFGTNGHTAIGAHYDSHDRVIMFTDDQMHDSAHTSKAVPALYTFNLAGYAPSSTEAGANGRHTFGGFSDATFSMISVLENVRDSGWPFM